MIDPKRLSDLSELLSQFPANKWKLHDRRIEDDTQKWVVYQAGFDAVSDQRLQLIVDAMNMLPELISIAKEQIETEENPTEFSVSLVENMINKAITNHEKLKH